MLNVTERAAEALREVLASEEGLGKIVRVVFQGFG